MRSFDTIVVGLGAMGSAVTYYLSQLGLRILGIDRFRPPHALGSSHGETRIIREAYFEHPLYVPLVQRAYHLWKRLEQAQNRRLLIETGGLMIGSSEGIVFGGARRSAEEHSLPHDILTAAEIRKRFPALAPGDEMMGLWEPRAGILFPEACIESYHDLAVRCGVELRFEEAVLGWRSEGSAIRLWTAKGEYQAAKVVLSAGPWINSLISDMKLPLEVERQVLFWFSPRTGASALALDPGRCPVHLWEYESGRFFYGFPDMGAGVKVARHHEGVVTDADAVNREVGEEEKQSIRTLVERFVPSAAGPLKHSATCLYTNTPDSHFLIARHPKHAGVLIVSPCSGHGFKFASVIGEVVADLVCSGRSRFDLSLFGWRFPG